MIMRSSCVFAILSSLLLSAGTVSHAGTVTFYDGTFNNSDWSLTTFGTDSGHTVTLSQQLAGGNPGDYQQMEFNLSTSSPTGVQGLAFYTANSFNPGSSGAITGIDFSEDHFQTADLVGGFVLMQNGTIFGSYTPYFSGNNSWTNYSVSGLTANDFDAFGSTSEHPDFSANGAPITFGYYFARYSPPGKVDGGVDNWTVTIF
jgi:hypothetical protein